MYVKIHSSKKDNNRGSCRDLINYLEKENLDKDILSQTKFLITIAVTFLSIQPRQLLIITKGNLGKTRPSFT